MAAMRGFTGWVGTVLGTPDPAGLAQFYAGLVGGEVDERDADFVTLRVGDTTTYVAFQLERDHPAVVAVRAWRPADAGPPRHRGHLRGRGRRGGRRAGRSAG